MNSLRNKVQLIGNLGAAPEVKEVTGGRKMAKFSIATNEKFKNQKGEMVEETYWHKITLWGKQAEFAQKNFQKGTEIAVDGKLHPRVYEDKDGAKKYIVDIIVNEVMICGRKEKQNSSIED